MCVCVCVCVCVCDIEDLKAAKLPLTVRHYLLKMRKEASSPSTPSAEAPEDIKDVQADIPKSHLIVNVLEVHRQRTNRCVGNVLVGT